MVTGATQRASVPANASPLACETHAPPTQERIPLTKLDLLDRYAEGTKIIIIEEPLSYITYILNNDGTRDYYYINEGEHIDVGTVGRINHAHKVQRNTGQIVDDTPICIKILVEDPDTARNEFRNLVSQQAWATMPARRDADCFFMKLVPGVQLGTVLESGFIQSNIPARTPLNIRLRLAKQLTQQLAFYHHQAQHKPALLHNDLKPQNVMVYIDLQTPENSHIEIIDLGNAIQVSDGHNPATPLEVSCEPGIHDFKPPECVNKPYTASTASDNYLIAPLLLMLFGVGAPYPRLPDEATHDKLCEFHQTSQLSTAGLDAALDDIPSELRELIKRFLTQQVANKNPALRPSAETIFLFMKLLERYYKVKDNQNTTQSEQCIALINTLSVSKNGAAIVKFIDDEGYKLSPQTIQKLQFLISKIGTLPPQYYLAAIDVAHKKSMEQLKQLDDETLQSLIIHKTCASNYYNCLEQLITYQPLGFSHGTDGQNDIRAYRRALDLCATRAEIIAETEAFLTGGTSTKFLDGDGSKVYTYHWSPTNKAHSRHQFFPEKHKENNVHPFIAASFILRLFMLIFLYFKGQSKPQFQQLGGQGLTLQPEMASVPGTKITFKHLALPKITAPLNPDDRASYTERFRGHEPKPPAKPAVNSQSHRIHLII